MPKSKNVYVSKAKRAAAAATRTKRAEEELRHEAKERAWKDMAGQVFSHKFSRLPMIGKKVGEIPTAGLPKFSDVVTEAKYASITALTSDQTKAFVSTDYYFVSHGPDWNRVKRYLTTVSDNVGPVTYYDKPSYACRSFYPPTLHAPGYLLGIPIAPVIRKGTLQWSLCFDVDMADQDILGLAMNVNRLWYKSIDDAINWDIKPTRTSVPLKHYTGVLEPEAIATEPGASASIKQVEPSLLHPLLASIKIEPEPRLPNDWYKLIGVDFPVRLVNNPLEDPSAIYKGIFSSTVSIKNLPGRSLIRTSEQLTLTRAAGVPPVPNKVVWAKVKDKLIEESKKIGSLTYLDPVPRACKAFYPPTSESPGYLLGIPVIPVLNYKLQLCWTLQYHVVPDPVVMGIMKEAAAMWWQATAYVKFSADGHESLLNVNSSNSELLEELDRRRKEALDSKTKLSNKRLVLRSESKSDAKLRERLLSVAKSSAVIYMRLLAKYFDSEYLVIPMNAADESYIRILDQAMRDKKLEWGDIERIENILELQSVALGILKRYQLLNIENTRSSKDVARHAFLDRDIAEIAPPLTLMCKIIRTESGDGPPRPKLDRLGYDGLRTKYHNPALTDKHQQILQSNRPMKATASQDSAVYTSTGMVYYGDLVTSKPGYSAHPTVHVPPGATSKGARDVNVSSNVASSNLRGKYADLLAAADIPFKPVKPGSTLKHMPKEDFALIGTGLWRGAPPSPFAVTGAPDAGSDVKDRTVVGIQSSHKEQTAALPAPDVQVGHGSSEPDWHRAVCRWVYRYLTGNDSKGNIMQIDCAFIARPEPNVVATLFSVTSQGYDGVIVTGQAATRVDAISSFVEAFVRTLWHLTEQEALEFVTDWINRNDSDIVN